MITVKELIDKITKELVSISETPRLDTEILVSKVLKKSRTDLFAFPEVTLTQKQNERLLNYIRRRQLGEPIAYILGEKEFWSLNLTVTPDVLIPRPETEILVEWVLEHFDKEEELYIADLGTGSGAIAIAIGFHRPFWKIDGVDNSRKALKIAEHNSKKHNINNINFYWSDWCSELPRRDYNIIVGNPPYVPQNDKHLAQLHYEPSQALISGPDGLEGIRIIIREAKLYLVEGGWLILEHGFDQSQQIIALMKEGGYQDIQDCKDLSGLPRMIIARRK